MTKLKKSLTQLRNDLSKSGRLYLPVGCFTVTDSVRCLPMKSTPKKNVVQVVGSNTAHAKQYWDLLCSLFENNQDYRLLTLSCASSESIDTFIAALRYTPGVPYVLLMSEWDWDNIVFNRQIIALTEVLMKSSNIGFLVIFTECERLCYPSIRFSDEGAPSISQAGKRYDGVFSSLFEEEYL